MESLFINELIKLLNDMPSGVNTLLLLILIIFVGIIYKYFKKNFDKVMQEIIYTKSYIYASDKAAEHSLGNGYGKKRDEELKKALEKENFIMR